MFATASISFREFLEVFLIVGVFLGISKKLNLNKEFEIKLATGVGIILSLFLATGTYLFGEQIQSFLTEKNIELFESYLMIFSGVFIIYTTISLHNLLNKIQVKTAAKVQQKLKNNLFDISLFFTIILLVMREGFEIALFTASTSLISVFINNIAGLMIGFISASFVGILLFFTYINFSIKKILKLTEYFIILLGIIMIGEGLIKLIF